MGPLPMSSLAVSAGKAARNELLPDPLNNSAVHPQLNEAPSDVDMRIGEVLVGDMVDVAFTDPKRAYTDGCVWFAWRS